MNINDGNAYSIDAWNGVFVELRNTFFDDEDIADYIEGLDDHAEHQRVSNISMAHTLQYVYKKIDKDEEGAQAALRATVQHYSTGQIPPVALVAIADGFCVRYCDFDEPLQDRLDEDYSKMPLKWLSDHGRRGLEEEVCKDSEIWVDDDDLPGVWVFTKPGFAS